MKKYLPYCLSALALIISMIALMTPHPVSKNFLGFVTGYGSCPSCGDSWNWKEHSGGIPLSGNHGLMICDECMDQPAKLNTTKICRHLNGANWSPVEVLTAYAAIENLKSQH